MSEERKAYLVDKRLEWLYQRMEAARRHYHNTDQRTNAAFFADLASYNHAVHVYNYTATSS